MYNEADFGKIHLRLKRLNLTACADNRAIRHQIRKSNFIKKIYFYTIPFFIALHFFFKHCNCDFFKNQSEIILIAISILIFAVSAILKTRARSNFHSKCKDGFFIPKNVDFKKNINVDLARIKGLCKFEKNLLEFALIQYRNKWNCHNEMHYLFGSTTSLWAISIIAGSVFGYEVSKQLNIFSEIDMEILIDNILKNNFYLLLIWYTTAALAYAVDNSYDKNAGKTPHQRRDYMVALIECAIRIKSEEKREAEQNPMPESSLVQPSPTPISSPSRLSPTQDRPVCLLTQLRNFIYK